MNSFQNRKRGTLLTEASFNSFISPSEENKKKKASFQNSDSSSKDISVEDLWYPVSHAQKQKEQEEVEWIKKHPNASTGELWYPSMRLSKNQEVAKQLADMEEKVAMEQKNEVQSKMSQEELYYPVMYAQQQKEQEEAEWIKNNPDASAGELLYPSMRPAKNQEVAKELADMEEKVAMEKKNETQSKMSQEELLDPVVYAQQQEVKQDTENTAQDNRVTAMHKESAEKAAIAQADATLFSNLEKLRNGDLTVNKKEIEQRLKEYRERKHPDPDKEAFDAKRKLREEQEKIQQDAHNTAKDNRKAAMHKKSAEKAAYELEWTNYYSDKEKFQQGDPTITKEYLVRKGKELRDRKHPDPDKEAFDAKEFSNAFTDGWQTSSFGSKFFEKPEPRKNMTTFDQFAYGSGQLLGNMIEPLAVGLTAAAIAPAGAGAATFAAVGIATSAIYSYGDELYRQHKNGEEIDSSKAYQALTKDGLASTAVLLTAKKLKPFFDSLEKLPAKEVMMLVAASGKMLADLGTRLAVEFGSGGEINWEDFSFEGAKSLVNQK